MSGLGRWQRPQSVAHLQKSWSGSLRLWKMQVREASLPRAPGRSRLSTTSTAPSSFILPWGQGTARVSPSSTQHPQVQLPAEHPNPCPSFPLPAPQLSSHLFQEGAVSCCSPLPGNPKMSPQFRGLFSTRLLLHPPPRGTGNVPTWCHHGDPGDTTLQTRLQVGTKSPTPSAGPAAFPNKMENRDQERSRSIRDHHQGLRTTPGHQDTSPSPSPRQDPFRGTAP